MVLESDNWEKGPSYWIMIGPSRWCKAAAMQTARIQVDKDYLYLDTRTIGGQCDQTTVLVMWHRSRQEYVSGHMQLCSFHPPGSQQSRESKGGWSRRLDVTMR